MAFMSRTSKHSDVLHREKGPKKAVLPGIPLSVFHLDLEPLNFSYFNVHHLFEQDS